MCDWFSCDSVNNKKVRKKSINNNIFKLKENFIKTFK